MLCDVCKNGLEGIWDPTQTPRLCSLEYFGEELPESAEGPDIVFGHHKDEASFRRSIDEGCAMCNRFGGIPERAKAPNNPLLEALDYFSVFWIYRVVEDSKEQVVMKCLFHSLQGGFCFVPYGGFNVFNGLTDSRTTVPRYDYGLEFDLGPSTSDVSTWRTLERWMDVCLSTHTSCQPSKETSTYRPSRLLELNSTGTYRLIGVHDMPPTLQYVALSYCWGTEPLEGLLRLMKTTEDYLSNGQDIDTLPKTFKEAAEIAQRFGVNYLWIDRLCIFQDSLQDWQQEAASMQKVYQNALFSIAALGAKDSNGGCFFSREPEKVVPSIVHLQFKEGEQAKPFRFELDKGWSWRLSFEDEPLLKRAWVVQERLIAPRTIYFGSLQVFWECRESQCAETHPLGVAMFDDQSMASNGEHEPYRNVCGWKDLLDFPGRDKAGDEYEQLFYDWDALIWYYSGQNLTVTTDKLVAISGMAKHMREMLHNIKPGPHRYLAGHWEDKLIDSLCWLTHSWSVRAPMYRAPSWSWACLEGKVYTFVSQGRSGQVQHTSVEAVDVVSLTGDDTGEVVSGSVTLRGPCATMSIDLELKNDDWYGSENQRSWTGVQEGKWPPSVNKSLGRPVPQVYFDTADDMCETPLLLWLTSCSDEVLYGKGLVLTCLGDGTYRRIGIALCYFASNDEALDFKNSLDERCLVVV
ncbi:HET-domain-containing protein [Curvularia clavata]|uniref:HET-domain-containing protein n=1 Tax=Curvularia clavata TaxID=95742 RepID=A0A9Q8Z5Q7_CURCL|nr:HET-domain-containing protein [Curvularia clavata]